MRSFGGERVQGLLDSMGLVPDEPIEHPMVTQAMANARAKVAERVGSGPASRARSMEEWMLLNAGSKVR